MSLCREEIQRQQDQLAYQRRHEAGLTEEARKDMARLAIVRQQREEAARKKEAERKGKRKLYWLAVSLPS